MPLTVFAFLPAITVAVVVEVKGFCWGKRDMCAVCKLLGEPVQSMMIQGVFQPRMFAFSTHGTRRYDQVAYQAGDALLFGSETCGLPADLRAGFDADHLLRLPMCASNRSMNLANTAAVVVFEAWRQHGFAGSA